MQRAVGVGRTAVQRDRLGADERPHVQELRPDGLRWHEFGGAADEHAHDRRGDVEGQFGEQTSRFATPMVPSASIPRYAPAGTCTCSYSGP